MNLSPRWAHYLSSFGLDCVHWSTVGCAGATDIEIILYAKEHGYSIVTHDLDFSAILAATKEARPSVVQIRSIDLNPRTIGVQVAKAIITMESELQLGALVTIDPGKTRLRLLPF
ncbi:MAG: DUF5615 family PIN-like protein [Coriobacteriia bacterium]|nr:DUF5615 family PIN-like protein [Coriobacteriia bacterium]